MTPLNVPNNTFAHTKATAVNARGDVLGAYSLVTGSHPEGFPYIPVRWVGGQTLQILGLYNEPNRTSTKESAFDMNDNGDVVGYSESVTTDHGTVTRLVEWAGGATTPTDLLGLPVVPVSGGPTVPHINNNGLVVAQVGSNLNAAVYLNGKWVDLPATSPGSATRAYDINDKNQIIGDSGGAPILWQVNEDTGTIFPASITLPKRATARSNGKAPKVTLAAINNAGDILGQSDQDGQVLLTADSAYKDYIPVGDLLPPGSGWSGVTVAGFSDGNFTGSGTLGGHTAAFLLAPDKAQLAVAPVYQVNSPWSDTRLLDSPDADDTIGNVGCVLTSLGMALHAAGVGIDKTPADLNSLLIQAETDPDNPRVSYDKSNAQITNWPIAAQIAIDDWGSEDTSLHFHRVKQKDESDPTTLRGLVTGPNAHPVLVTVRNLSGNNHTVLVTGIYGQTFTINDPGYKVTRRQTLSFYDNAFTIRGYIADPPDLSAVSVIVGGDGPGVGVSVTDDLGRQAGVGTSGLGVTDIPGSTVFQDDPERDLSDTAGARMTVRSVDVFNPQTRSLKIRVTGDPGAAYHLLLSSASPGGAVSPGASFVGTLPASGVVTFPVSLDSNITPQLGTLQELITAPPVYTLTTFAGGGSALPGDKGPATEANIGWPVGVAVNAGGDIFLADADQSRVRRVDHATGVISTVAGNGTADSSGDGGPATAAAIMQPMGVAVDGEGNLFIADAGTDTVRRVDHATGVISTVAGGGTTNPGDGGPATGARLGELSYIAVDPAGNLFITEQTGAYEGRIRRVDAATGVITTVAGGGKTFLINAGGGPATATDLWPAGIAVSASGDLFIADKAGGRVGRVDHATGIIATYAGGGPAANEEVDNIQATSEYLLGPEGVALDAAGNLYITGSNVFGGVVYRVDAGTGILNLISGSPGGVGNSVFLVNGGMGNPATLGHLYGVTVDAAGNVYTGAATSLAGSGPGVLKLSPATGAPLTITPGTLPTAALGRAYTQILTATGGTGPYRFAATGSRPDVSHFLPDGMSLSPAGVFSGIPQKVPSTVAYGGKYAFEVTVTDAAGNVGFVVFEFAVSQNPVAVQFSPTTLPSGQVGVAYHQTLTASGPSSSYTFTVTAGELPAGMSLSPDGLLSGTPTASGAGTTFTITAVSTAGDIGSQSYTLAITPATVLPPPVSPPTSPPPVSPPTVPPTVPPAVPPPSPPTPPLVQLVGTPQFAVGVGPSVQYDNPDRTTRYTTTPFPGFAGAVRTSTADFNGDGVPDVVVGTGPGGPTHVVVLDGKDQHTLFGVDPFEASFAGGVYVAAGDLNGDGAADLVITPDEGGGPRVRVFSGNGFGLLADFFGIADPNFRGGARAAIADVNGDGIGDLVVSAGFGGGPRVAGFDGTTLASGFPERVFADFFLFEQTLRNGVFVAAGDLNGDGFADVIAGGGPGGGPRVFALDGKALVTENRQVPLANFFGGDTTSRGGIRVAIKNLDGDAKADIVVGAGDGAGSRVTSYLGTTIAPAGTPPAAFDFSAAAGFTGGVYVG